MDDTTCCKYIWTNILLVKLVGGTIFSSKKQIKVEESFGRLQERLTRVLEELETKANVIANHVTGGDSFVYLLPTQLDLPPKDLFQFLAMVKGKYPVYGVKVTITDLLHAGDEEPIEASIGDQGLGIAKILRLINNNTAANKQAFKVFFTARNGCYWQVIALEMVGGEWTVATKVVASKRTWGIGIDQNDRSDEKILWKRIYDNFPRNSKGEVDWPDPFNEEIDSE